MRAIVLIAFPRLTVVHNRWYTPRMHTTLTLIRTAIDQAGNPDALAKAIGLERSAVRKALLRGHASPELSAALADYLELDVTAWTLTAAAESARIPRAEKALRAALGRGAKLVSIAPPQLRGAFAHANAVLPRSAVAAAYARRRALRSTPVAFESLTDLAPGQPTRAQREHLAALDRWCAAKLDAVRHGFRAAESASLTNH